MNLLPKSKKEFSTKSYWESFFGRRKDAFEWYGEYSDLRNVLGKYCKLTDDILMSGCGNSNLSEEMYNDGYRGIINIDISDVVLKQMNNKSKEHMPYLKMDMKETTFDNESFHVVIDKGTLDAIFTDDDVIVTSGVLKMFKEILRVLKIGGRYICITLAQQHILNELFRFFQNLCFVRVHQIECNKEDKVGGLGGHLPVFAFICTKMKTKLVTPVLEMVFSGKSSIEKFKDTEEIKNKIKMLQEFALVKNKLQTSSLCETITVDLWVNDKSFKEPRYSITIVDIDEADLSTCSGNYAVFIVSQGRENEMMFATESGRKQLAEAAGFTRLAITCLHRGHIYKDLDEIKAELSEKVMDLAPLHVDKNDLVPFLSISSDIGNRVVIHEGKSSIYGSFVIEDIQSNEQYYYRQLVFTEECDNIQEKVRLKVESKKKKKSKKRIADHRYLMRMYERNILAGFSFLYNIDFQNPEKIDVLIIGLYGGCFVGFLLDLYPDIYVTCITKDPTMIDISKDWFGLPDSDRLTFISQDIKTFLSDCQHTEKSSYDIVIIDHIPVKCQASVLELSEEVFLDIERIIKDTGLLCLVTNDVLSKGCPQNVFPIQYVSKIENIILQFSIKRQSSNNNILEQTKLKVTEIVNYITCKRNGCYDKSEWNILDDFIDNLVAL